MRVIFDQLTQCVHIILHLNLSIFPASFHRIVLNIMLFNNFFTAGPVWKTRDPSEQILLEDYFTVAFNEVEPTEKYKFCRYMYLVIKKKTLYASLVFKTLKIHLYDSSINTVRPGKIRKYCPGSSRY